MSPHSRKLLALAVAAASLSLAGQASAETLDTVQVTAQNTAGADTLIDREQLELSQASDLEDIFRSSPDIAVGGALGVAQKIYVRGIEDTNLNVSIDGAVQAGYLFHHQGRVGVEPELLKQVDVSAGAGLATDGAGALGGAIRFTTVDAEDLLRDGEKAGALVKLGYYSNGDVFKGSGTVFGKASDQLSAIASVVTQEGDSFESGNGTVAENTESDIQSGFVKLVARPDSNQRVALSHEVRSDDGDRNLRAHFTAGDWNPETAQESTRKTTTLNYEIDPAGDLLDIEATVYHTDSFISQLNDDDQFTEAGIESLGADLRNTLRSGKHKLVFGGDYRRDTGSYYRSTLAPVSDEVAHVAGLYLQDHYEFSDRLMLTAGVRYDDYRLTDSQGMKFSASGLSPNIGAEYQISEALTLNAGYARALRGQKIKEIYVNSSYTNSADLKEETADNLELGLSYQKDALSLEGTVFVSRINDFVDGVSRVMTNTGDLKTHGFNARAAYDWDNTRASLSFSYVRPELDGQPLTDGDMSLGTSIGDTWVADVQHLMPEYDLTVGWSGTFVHRLTDVADGQFEKPGYARHDIYARWLPTQSEDLSLTLTVNNLFDKQYLDHASYGISASSGNTLGVAEPGRDIRLTLAARF